jgi:hypothetical protein
MKQKKRKERRKYFREQQIVSNRANMIQAKFENGIENENNFQIQEIDFQNGIDEDDA